MIKFDLKCDIGHIFEASFDDSKSFDFQRKKNLIECPYCSSCKITKSIMAPNVSSKSNKNKKVYKNQQKVFATYDKQIKKLKSEIEKNFTYVGNKFPEEARKIYYGEADDKSIYGEATEKESKELLDEGISLIKLPFDKKDKIKKKN